MPSPEPAPPPRVPMAPQARADLAVTPAALLRGWAHRAWLGAALLGAGCGYGSVYPQPQLRTGAPLVDDTSAPEPDPADGLPCSPTPDTTPEVDVLIVNSAPVAIFIKGSDCAELPYLELPASYTEHFDVLPDGTSLVARSLEGVFLGGAVVAADASGAWQVTLP